MKNSLRYFDERDVVVDLKSQLDDYGYRLTAMKGIERAYKKDGSPFAKKCKNFVGKNFLCSESQYNVCFNVCYLGANEFDHRNTQYVYSLELEVDQIWERFQNEIEKVELRIKGLKETIELIQSGKCELINEIIRLRDLYNTETENSVQTKDYGPKYVLHYALSELL